MNVKIRDKNGQEDLYNKADVRDADCYKIQSAIRR